MKRLFVLAPLSLTACQHFPYGSENARVSAFVPPPAVILTDLPVYKQADYLALIRAYFYDGPTSLSDKLSGFVILHRDKQYVVTAGHIIRHSKNFSNIRVWFKNDPEKYHETELLGYDLANDTAVLGFKDPDFRFAGRLAVLGDSDTLRISDTIYNLGNPLGFRWKITDGWVEALDVKIARHDCTATMIRHNATAGHGSSGGPVINEKGEVVAMTTRMFPRTLTSQLSNQILAIPINTVKSRLDALIAGYKQ